MGAIGPTLVSNGLSDPTDWTRRARGANYQEREGYYAYAIAWHDDDFAALRSAVDAYGTALSEYDTTAAELAHAKREKAEAEATDLWNKA
jgi:hypothetical protein